MSRRKRACLLAAGVVAVVVVGATPATAADVVTAAKPSLVSDLFSTDGVGKHPTSRYDIGYDPGAWNDFDRKLIGFFTAGAFALMRMLVGVALHVVSWAYSFSLAAVLAEPAEEMAAVYEQRILGPIDALHAVLFAALAYAGWHVLRGRLARGAGELAVSLVVAVAGTVALADPGAAISGGLDATGRLSSDVLAATSGASDASNVAPQAAVDAAVHEALIEDSHDIINWGAPLDGACAKVRDEIVSSGPHGTEDLPRDVMTRAPGCERHAEFNADPTWDRLGAAILAFVVAAVVGITLILVAGTVVVAQVVGVGLIALMPFAAVAGVLPGAARQPLWRWIAGAVLVLAVIAAMALFLSFLLLSLSAFLSATEGGLVERFGLLLVLAVVLAGARRRVLAASRRAAQGLGRRLEAARVGGSRGGIMAPALAGGAGGLSAAQLIRDGRSDVRTVVYPARRMTRRSTHLLKSGRSNSAHKRGSAVRNGGSDPHRRPFAGRAVKAVAGGTVNLPVAGPRAAARATVSVEHAARRSVAGIPKAEDGTRAWARRWRHGATHPVAVYLEELSRERRDREGRGR